MGTSCVDGVCQTESGGQVDTRCVQVITECHTEVSLSWRVSEMMTQTAYSPFGVRIIVKASEGKRMIVKASEGKRIILKASEGDHLRSIDRVLGKQISIAGLAVACPNRDEELKVVKKVASSYGETMLDMNADKITIDQVIAICDKMHTTTNRVSKWWQQ